MDNFIEKDRFQQYKCEYFDKSTNDKSCYINLEPNFRIGNDDHCPIPKDFNPGNDFDKIMKII